MGVGGGGMGTERRGGGGALRRRAAAAAVALAASAVALASAGAGWEAVHAHAETARYDVGDGMELEVSHPGTVVGGGEFAVSFLVRNGGWEDKDAVMVLAKPGGAVVPAGAAPDGGRIAAAVIDAGRIAAGGSHGQAAAFAVSREAQPGTHYINLEYSHILLENNEVPREPLRADLAIPVVVVAGPRVDVAVSAPESLFAGAEFPLGITVGSDVADLADVRVGISTPAGVELRGKSLHSFSLIERGRAVEVESRIAVPPGDVSAESRVPLEVSVSYAGGDGERREETRTVSPVLRPRAFMELAADGGVWIGGLFIAPYVSIGTLVGVPAGALLSLAVRRRMSGGKKGGGGGEDP